MDKTPSLLAPRPPHALNHCLFRRLFQNNTAKLVKQLSKGGETEGESGVCLKSPRASEVRQCGPSALMVTDSSPSELRKLATVLVDGWMAVIRSQSVGASSGTSPSGKYCISTSHPPRHPTIFFGHGLLVGRGLVLMWRRAGDGE